MFPLFLSFTTYCRRTENSLKIWVFEVKGLSDAKKYFCEIHVDDKIYARYANSEIQISISNDFELSLYPIIGLLCGA